MRVLPAVLALLTYSLPWVCRAEPILVDGIVAVVGSDIITLSELNEAQELISGDPSFAPDPTRPLRAQVLDTLIEDQLINQAAAADGIVVTSEEVDRAIEGWMRQNELTRDALERELKRQGVTWDDYQANMRKHLLQSRFIEAKVSPRVNVSDAQVRAYYSREIAKLEKEQVAQVWLIFLPFSPGASPEERARVQEQAKVLADQVRAGADFSALAKVHSAHPTAGEGGLLGTFHAGELMGLLDGMAFSAASAVVSEPAATAEGVFLVRSTLSEQTSSLPFEEARPQIESVLFQQELERQLDLWLVEARRGAHVRVLVAEDQL